MTQVPTMPDDYDPEMRIAKSFSMSQSLIRRLEAFQKAQSAGVGGAPSMSRVAEALLIRQLDLIDANPDEAGRVNASPIKVGRKPFTKMDSFHSGGRGGGK